MSTFLELQDRALDSTKRDGLSNRTEIRSLINQAYLELHARLRLKVTAATKTLTVNVAAYTLSGAPISLSDVQSLRHIVITDSVTAQSYLLEEVPIDKILLYQQTQAVSQGGLLYYGLDGLDNITFFPAPTSTTTQATFTYVARPALLVLDVDVPANIPVEFHDVIALGAIYKAIRVQNPNYVGGYYAAWQQGIGDIRKWRNRYGNSMPRKAMVKGSRSAGFPHDNSYYSTGMP